MTITKCGPRDKEVNKTTLRIISSVRKANLTRHSAILCFIYALLIWLKMTE